MGGCLGLFMKKFALAVSVLAASAMGASAADMDVKAPLYKAPEAAVSTWTGFYVGGSVGGEQANANWATTSIAVAAPGFVIPPPTVDGSSPRSFHLSSGRFGGFAGYDYQFAPRWVAGIVLDAAILTAPPRPWECPAARSRVFWVSRDPEPMYRV